MVAVPFAALGCDASSAGRAPHAEPARAVASAAPTAAAVKAHVETRYPAADRVVAIGDLHGDVKAARAALKVAGVFDGAHWSGGKTVLVQTGDVLDRGDNEKEILDLLEQVGGEAEKAGGRVLALNGNHELMNAAGDFRYVTPGGFAAFAGRDGRAAAFAPGGREALRFAKHPVAAIVGDSVFVHGGVLPKYADGGALAKLNDDVASWLAGGDRGGARILDDQDGPVWTRRYSDAPDEAACKLLDQALALLGAKRMVVGHTVMKTITPACGEKLWRIDVGMAAFYGGRPEALEILRGGEVRALRE